MDCSDVRWSAVMCVGLCSPPACWRAEGAQCGGQQAGCEKALFKGGTHAKRCRSLPAYAARAASISADELYEGKLNAPNARTQDTKVKELIYNWTASTRGGRGPLRGLPSGFVCRGHHITSLQTNASLRTTAHHCRPTHIPTYTNHGT